MNISIIIVSAFAAGFCMAGELSPSCKEYFAQIDKMVEQSKDNPNAEQMVKMHEDQKKQFEQLPAETQESTCKMALDQMKKAMEAAQQAK